MGDSSTWSFAEPSPHATVLGYVVLRFRLHRETAHWVGECIDLGISSFGATIDEAIEATEEAATLYLDTLESEGERERFFLEHGITLHAALPVPDTITFEMHPGEWASPQRAAVLAGHS